MELARSIEGVTDRGLRGRPRQPVAGTIDLRRGVLPASVELEELGPEHEAAAAERDRVGHRFTPASEGGRPLLCSTEIEHGLIRLDRGAVHDPDVRWCDLASGDRDHGLVEERDSALDLAESDER